ncbi:hypothetical protein JAAARDRAFT_193761 [Jaapia argillacea MUCL 33604]|uniref:Uncharacterized protein n=1 Tax=Jaapia argillacea MUCL 33604 TaxID=933084 RepID=A0A067PRS6_9AGAM|nr:hypothetical protein JAAARDRAFT_193761 [Jaapia argillacea MUCL 33604]
MHEQSESVASIQGRGFLTLLLKTVPRVNLPSTSSIPSIVVRAPGNIEQEDIQDSGVALSDPSQSECTTPPLNCRGRFESAITFGPSMSCPASSYRVYESPSFDILSPPVGRPSMSFEEDMSTFSRSSIENGGSVLGGVSHYPNRIRPDRTLRRSLMKGLGIFVAPIASQHEFISTSSLGETGGQQSSHSMLETGFDPLSPKSFANAGFAVELFDTPPMNAAFGSSRTHSPLLLLSPSLGQRRAMELPDQQQQFLKSFNSSTPASSTSVSVLRLPMASSSSFDSPSPRPSSPTPGSAVSLRAFPCGSPLFHSPENTPTTGSTGPTPPKAVHTPKSKSTPRFTTLTQSPWQRCRQETTPPCLLVSHRTPPSQPCAPSLSRSPVLSYSQAGNYRTCSPSSHRIGSASGPPRRHGPPGWSPPPRPVAPSPGDSPEQARYPQSCFKTPSSSWQSIASGGSPILNPSTSRSPYSRRRLGPSPSYSPRFRRTPCAASLTWSPQTPSSAAYLQASTSTPYGSHRNPTSTALLYYRNAVRSAAPSPDESPEQAHYLESIFVATSPSVSSVCFLAPPSLHSCSLLPSSSTFLSFTSLTPPIPSSPPTGSPKSFQERPESVHDIDSDLWFRYLARRREDKAFEINLYKMLFVLKRAHHGERVGANLGREQAVMQVEGRHGESKRLASERERSERMSMED